MRKQESPEEREKRRAEHYALRDKLKNIGLALVVEEFGLPTEPNCQEWPHCLCTKWVLENGVELHVDAWTDGPSITAYSAPTEVNQRGSRLAASILPRNGDRPSVREWLQSIGFIKSPESPEKA